MTIKPEKTITINPNNYMTPEEVAEEIRCYLDLAKCEWKKGRFMIAGYNGSGGFVEISGYAYDENGENRHDLDVDWGEVVGFSSAQWVDADDGSLILVLTI